MKEHRLRKRKRRCTLEDLLIAVTEHLGVLDLIWIAIALALIAVMALWAA
jgi:hypothetical protein